MLALVLLGEAKWGKALGLKKVREFFQEIDDQLVL